MPPAHIKTLLHTIYTCQAISSTPAVMPCSIGSILGDDNKSNYNSCLGDGLMVAWSAGEQQSQADKVSVGLTWRTTLYTLQTTTTPLPAPRSVRFTYTHNPFALTIMTPYVTLHIDITD